MTAKEKKKKLAELEAQEATEVQEEATEAQEEAMEVQKPVKTFRLLTGFYRTNGISYQAGAEIKSSENLLKFKNKFELVSTDED